MLMKNIPHHDGNKFSWNALGGVAFASDLPDKIYGRVFDDAVDVGFYVKSHKTGVSVLFVFKHEIRQGNEVIGTEYVEYVSHGNKTLLEIVIWNT